MSHKFVRTLSFDFVIFIGIQSTENKFHLLANIYFTTIQFVQNNWHIVRTRRLSGLAGANAPNE